MAAGSRSWQNLRRVDPPCLEASMEPDDPEEEEADEMELVGVVGAEESDPLSCAADAGPPANSESVIATGTSWQQVHMHEW